MRKKIISIMALIICLSLSGCENAHNAYKRVKVINPRTGKILYEKAGKMAVMELQDALYLTIENDDGSTTKDKISLKGEVIYTIERLE